MSIRLPPTAPTLTRRDSGAVYRAPDDLRRTVEVALACGRPLLLLGDPGSGKSTLAPWVAGQLGWPCERLVVTSRTQASDLCWTFDAVQRLADAQVQTKEAPLKPVERYVRKGPLWKAFTARNQAGGTVVLIDEIDKADPDVPNDLLGPLGSMSFHVDPLNGRTVRLAKNRRVLLVLTSNGERELPAALIRRCIVTRLKLPDAKELAAIAREHFPAEIARAPEGFDARLEALAARFVKLRDESARTGGRKISTAEFLDAIEAVLQWGEDEQLWDLLQRVAMEKAPLAP